ncbi:MAG: DUF2520 domain-containing protein [Phycisphaerae bacterium]|nr:DUF2520 domain-containing protein [Phycisphaerae bacterium]
MGVLAARAGMEIAAVGGGHRGDAQSAARLMGPSVRSVSAAEAAASAPLVLLTVPDDAIALVAEQLAQQGAFQDGAVVAHCSGALDSDILSAARQAGCEVGSMHPLQTFPTVEAALAKLPGTPFFIEGTPAACERLDAFAAAIGGQPHRLRSDAKALYHAAAAMTSNFLVSLLDAASAVMALALTESANANREQALAALEPLLRATVDNVLALGPEAALTGPIARGDTHTVARHWHALAQFGPEFRDTYRALAKLTIELALRKGTLAEDIAREIKETLRH